MTARQSVKKVRDASGVHLEAVDERATELEDDRREQEDAGSDGAGPLSDYVGGLGKVLKAQLAQLTEANESLDAELHAARLQAEAKNERSHGLAQRIQDLELETVEIADLRSEAKQLNRERDALTAKIQDLSGMLTVSEQRVQEISELLDRFRTERNDASAEAACLDSQFARAMRVIGELRGALSESQGREEGLKRHVDELKQDVATASSRSRSYKDELAESHKALEEVRRSILAAAKESAEVIY